ncbi:alpha-amylase [Patescibacteria group bacterium]|nr:alpha-amylase [Patescibacteria group bacterium]
MNSLAENLVKLYGETIGKALLLKIRSFIGVRENRTVHRKLNERDLFFITYADTFQEPETVPLKSLANFLSSRMKGLITGVHILPFFPYSSDRGYSVIDFYKVKAELGNWEDIGEISRDYTLMADLVLNHVSTQHLWFKKFLEGDPKYSDFFVWYTKDNLPPSDLLIKVARPRATPLLTRFNTSKGERYVWTTYSVESSTDQVDLNYHNPEVLFEVIKIMVFLLGRGVSVIRLDAIPYIWKKLGTDCYLRPEVHTIVKILKAVLKMVKPDAYLVAQASVPFEKNTAFFGKNGDEADLVYNFPLAPLILYSFFKEDPSALIKWAKELVFPKDNVGFLNTLGTHDGLGLNGARGSFDEIKIAELVDHLKGRGVLVAEKSKEGKKVPYELDTTWWSVLDDGDRESKFLSSIALMLSFKGVPLFYYGLLFGLENDIALYKKTGVKRDVNRGNVNLKKLFEDPKRRLIFDSVKKLIERRKTISAFSPSANQSILEVHPKVFAFERGSDGEKVACFYNFSNGEVVFQCRGKEMKIEPYGFLWTVNFD